jgi:hypothetical protein
MAWRFRVDAKAKNASSIVSVQKVRFRCVRGNYKQQQQVPVSAAIRI